MTCFEPSGFFALRAPLLPFDELLCWSQGLAAPAAQKDSGELEQALADDRRELRRRLRVAVARPAVREALFVASPDLDDALDLWIREPESERGRKIELALVRYFLRMAGRATPFGLFAGCSVGTIDGETRLAIGSVAECRRHTRLDMDYLSALVDALGRDPALANTFTYYPNSSLYQAAGRYRYVESRIKERRRTYHLVAADHNDCLAATLSRAAAGAGKSELAASLTGNGISGEAAEGYIHELIESQLLVPDLALPVTGPEPARVLANQLSGNAPHIAEPLLQTVAALAEIDAAGIGLEPARYRALAKNLEGLPVKVELPKLFQVDLVRSAPGSTLGREVIEEIVRGVEVLQRLFGRRRAGDPYRFIEAFTARYEGREVPLAEALDDEIGIGFPPLDPARNQPAPLLKDVALPSAPQETIEWSPVATLLFRKLNEALMDQSDEITLESSDLEAAQPKDLKPLPDAFEVMATVAATDETVSSRNGFRVFIRSISGPSGANLLGRFCHGDEAMNRMVESHLRAEEALRPDAVFAEIAHLPEGRLGNVLLRPVLRGYEIPYLGRSGAPEERQIPITDLLISIKDGRVHLRSSRLGREVIPRLTSAHNFVMSDSPVYRFLGTLQSQGTAAAMAWDWGVLRMAPFLPRVVMGRLVLSIARWRVSKQEIERLTAVEGAERFLTVRKWRVDRRLPRWIVLADGDNALPIDLDNALAIDALLHLIKHREEAVVTELFPGPEQLCARGPEGRFVHQLIVPFVRKNEVSRDEKKESLRAWVSPGISQPPVRRFPPGSEWLYAKLYTGTAIADQVLDQVIAPITEEIQKSGAADRWFFIRYADPDWHLRLRFHGTPERLHAQVLPTLQAAVSPLLADGRIWRMQIDTYEREVERYGGGEGIELSEQLFYADSEAVLEILGLLEPGDTGLDERWRLAVRGIDSLLEDLGFGVENKLALLNDVRGKFAKEFMIDKQVTGKLAERLRKERKNLEALLDPTQDSENPLLPGLEILERRSRQWATAIAELKACARARRLCVSLEELAASHIHMHANRLLRSAQRAQEMVIYDFLARLYESQVARASVSQRRGALIS